MNVLSKNMNVLDEIVAVKLAEIEEQKKTTSLNEMQKMASGSSQARRPFLQLFTQGPVLIVEVKPKSPSAGALTQSPLDIAKMYAQSEASAISVLTDKEYFGGDVELLQSVKAVAPQAILRKEFIIDAYQIYETKVVGADAFLLIANILTTQLLKEFIALGKQLQLDALVEVHDEEDVKKTLNTGAELIGINNRDLKTLKIDLAVTKELIKKIPSAIPVISESGLETAADVIRVRDAGARGILVGTSILRSENPTAKIAELKAALS